MIEIVGVGLERLADCRHPAIGIACLGDDVCPFEHVRDQDMERFVGLGRQLAVRDQEIDLLPNAAGKGLPFDCAATRLHSCGQRADALHAEPQGGVRLPFFADIELQMRCIGVIPVTEFVRSVQMQKGARA